MTGRITMLGINHWTEGKGGSYRTIQHFFTKDIPWSSLNWAVTKVFLKRHTGVILITGDATKVTKAGKETFGLGRFFSSIYSRAVPGIAFPPLLLLNIEKRSSWPMLERSDEENILDLKACHHVLRYARELFKILPKNTKPVNRFQLLEKMAA